MVVDVWDKSKSRFMTKEELGGNFIILAKEKGLYEMIIIEWDKEVGNLLKNQDNWCLEGVWFGVFGKDNTPIMGWHNNMVF